MTTLRWTVPLAPGDGRPGPKMTRQSIWEAMVEKAADPSPYVPYIVDCQVREQYQDGLLRAITYSDRGVVLERVFYEPERRMTFRMIDDPDIAEIVNEVGTDENGAFEFTLKVVLSAAAEERTQREPEFMLELYRLFSSSLPTIVQATLDHHSATDSH